MLCGVSTVSDSLLLKIVLVVRCCCCPSIEQSRHWLQTYSIKPVTSVLIYASLLKFPSFIWKPLHIWLSTWNKGVVHSFTYLFSVLVVRGGTLKTNTSSICGGAQGGWTTLVLPLANVTCTFWVHPALPPSSYMRALCQVGAVFLAFPRSKPTRHLGARQGNWQWLAMCFVLFPSPKSQVTV